MNTKQLAARLLQVSDQGADSVHPIKLLGLMSAVALEIERLDNLINNPHTADFLEAVKLEAAVARPLCEYHEDHGAVVWWRFPVNEPSYIGTPNDSDWPGYHTHWTPHPDVPTCP